jgi:hypothetical protein
VGNGVEGAWVTDDNGFSPIAFVDPTGAYLSFDPAGLLIDGSIGLAGTDWTFDPATVLVTVTGGTPVVLPLSASGTVALRQTFQGGNGAISYHYANANALAVSQGDLAATWTASGASLAIDATGALAGTASTSAIGDCLITGSITLLDPASHKNLYAVSATLADAPGGTCKLDTTAPYAGRAAITFANVGTAQAPVYQRSITVLARTAGHVWLYAVLGKS